MSAYSHNYETAGKNTQEPDLVIPRFYIEPVKNHFKSEQEGRPIHEEREMVHMIIPGNRTTELCEIVNQTHKMRWPKHYEAFKAGQKVAQEGTPIEQWPAIGVGQVADLKAANVFTVEQLACLPDNLLQNMGMGMLDLRRKAIAFLEAAKDSAAITRYAVENENLKSEIGILKDQMRELADRFTQSVNQENGSSPALSVPPAATRGRTRKEIVE